MYYDAIDHFSHGFMRYHPPQQAWIGDRDFELYSNVVSMAYQFHDQMLGTLLEKAGDDVTVILMSDHGFHPDHLRPASIPDIPAGPAIEHRDFGILVMSGPGIARDELLHGASVLDVAPTILTLFGLPVGEDMDGKVLVQSFDQTQASAPNEISSIPSWEDVPGRDGRHPPHTRLDPVAAHEALEQMIALGYIERPDEDREIAVEKTVRELQYNLGEAYQDDDRHLEAHRIFRDLHAKDPDEQRFAVRLFVSCQALNSTELGTTEEMRAIVDDLDGRRRSLYREAVAKVSEFRKLGVERARERGDAEPEKAHPEAKPEPGQEPLLKEDERQDYARWRNLIRFQPPVVDYLKAQVLTAEKRYADALESLEKVTSAHLVRPGLFLQTADLYMKLRRWREAEQVFEKALAIDPDNAHAHIGRCRMALRRRDFSVAAQAALDSLQRLHHYPMAHFLLGEAMTGMKDYERAAAAFRTAISFNPNFPEAHIHLARLLEKHLGDPESAREHRRLARRMRNRKMTRRAAPSTAEKIEEAVAPRRDEAALPAARAGMPSLEESLVVVTGLPRSGTSMFMQMIAAGGVPVMTDGLREPDEDNPRGYLEFEPVKNLLKDSRWLFEGRGKAVKIVVPLLAALPPGLPCRIVLCGRDLEEVLDSQEKMLVRRKQPLPATPERRRLLRDEYARTLARVKAALARRPLTEVLEVAYKDAVGDSQAVAERVNRFLGGGLDVSKMAAAIHPELHRNRA